MARCYDTGKDRGREEEEEEERGDLSGYNRKGNKEYRNSYMIITMFGYITRCCVLWWCDYCFVAVVTVLRVEVRSEH